VYTCCRTIYLLRLSNAFLCVSYRHHITILLKQIQIVSMLGFYILCLSYIYIYLFYLYLLFTIILSNLNTKSDTITLVHQLETFPISYHQIYNQCQELVICIKLIVCTRDLSYKFIILY
jgi:hypothetical protein